jgi:hypothetical protein
MAHNDSDSTNYIDDSADTASFKRFVEQEGQRGPAQTGGTGSGNGFRLVTLGIGVLVLVAIVVLLLR